MDVKKVDGDWLYPRWLSKQLHFSHSFILSLFLHSLLFSPSLPLSILFSFSSFCLCFPLSLITLSLSVCTPLAPTSHPRTEPLPAQTNTHIDIDTDTNTNTHAYTLTPSVYSRGLRWHYMPCHKSSHFL